MLLEQTGKDKLEVDQAQRQKERMLNFPLPFLVNRLKISQVPFSAMIQDLQLDEKKSITRRDHAQVAVVNQKIRLLLDHLRLITMTGAYRDIISEF